MAFLQIFCTYLTADIVGKIPFYEAGSVGIALLCCGGWIVPERRPVFGGVRNKVVIDDKRKKPFFSTH